MTTDDMKLVSAYARHHSEEAFATIVSRHVNLVYSVALRQLRDAHLAELIIGPKGKETKTVELVSGKYPASDDQIILKAK